MSEALRREEIDALAADGTLNDLGRRLIIQLQDLAQRLEGDGLSGDSAREIVRPLIAQLGDDLRMLRESRAGRTPTPAPSEGRPLQSRPDVPLDVLQRQLEALAEGVRMVVEEAPALGSAPIPDPEYGALMPQQHLAAMVLRARMASDSLSSPS